LLSTQQADHATDECKRTYDRHGHAEGVVVIDAPADSRLQRHLPCLAKTMGRTGRGTLTVYSIAGVSIGLPSANRATPRAPAQ
jgi:hypothetical protein